MNYQNLTNDLFKALGFSRNELDLFSVDLIKQLQTNSNQLLTSAHIKDLILAHTNFKNSLGLLATDSAFQKSGTITKQDAYDDVLDFIKQKEGLIKSEFKKGGAAYVEFYPAGVTEYLLATVEGIKNLLVRYVAAANKYKTILSQKFVDDITTLQTNYVNARSEQTDGIATNKSSQSIVRENRKILTLLLTKTVLLVAAESIEQPALFNSYFNFGLLLVDNENTTIKTDKPTPPPTL